MAYALRSSPFYSRRLWCGFDADSSRLPPPFSSFLISVVRFASAVAGFASCSVLFGFLYSFARRHRSYCFSMYLHRPSSLSGSSPCFYTAGAYCFAEGEGIEPPFHDLTPLLLILSANPPIKNQRASRMAGSQYNIKPFKII